MTAPLDIDAIRARCNAATPGRWQKANDHIVDVHGPDGGALICDCEDLGSYEYSLSERDAEANAEFIAAARSDVPALLAEVERLRARVAELEDEAHPEAGVCADCASTEDEAHGEGCEVTDD